MSFLSLGIRKYNAQVLAPDLTSVKFYHTEQLSGLTTVIHCNIVCLINFNSLVLLLLSSSSSFLFILVSALNKGQLILCFELHYVTIYWITEQFTTNAVDNAKSQNSRLREDKISIFFIDIFVQGSLMYHVISDQPALCMQIK